MELKGESARSWIDTYCTVYMYVVFFWNARARGDVTVALHDVTRRYTTLHVVTRRYMTLHDVTQL